MNLICMRTKMCGGGTSYRIYMEAKNKKPQLGRNGHAYTYHDEGRVMIPMSDVFLPEGADDLPACSQIRWDTFSKAREKGDRLAIMAAKRAFPELRGRAKVPLLWIWPTEESATVEIPLKVSPRNAARFSLVLS